MDFMFLLFVRKAFHKGVLLKVNYRKLLQLEGIFKIFMI